MEPHLASAEQVLKQLDSRAAGLSDNEARKRLAKHGFNELQEAPRPSPLVVFLKQFQSLLILVLLAATLVSALLGELLDASVIFIIVILNAVFGFVQERKAERAMQALKKLAAPFVTVRRDGRDSRIPARELVPGDVVVLETGVKIPADCRVLESFCLKVNEASLTGESEPADKNADALKGNLIIADRKNMVFAGTSAVYGRGLAVVTVTRMNTELGKIAHLVQLPEEEQTPLQKNLDSASKAITYLILGICAIIFTIGLVEGIPAVQMFLTSVSLAVAAIPEGLPAVITITLALGMQRMAAKNAIIRKLSAVETLGCTTIICADKTGTLTKDEMVVREIYADTTYMVTGDGYAPTGAFFKAGKKTDAAKEKQLALALQVAMFCNDARLVKNQAWEVIGDPTEGALLVAAAKAGVKLAGRRVFEVPFTSERKRMTTVHDAPSGRFVAMKGAPEVVLSHCTHLLKNNKKTLLTAQDKKKILVVNEQMASRGLRVLAAAYKTNAARLDETIERGLVFVGLLGMIDAARPEAAHAVALCKQAGIRVVMITGDHKLTAVAVARELGICSEADRVMTGAELDALDEKEFERVVQSVCVYARVSPEHKMRIVGALKQKGHVVAMTGDGVNDAPALKNADIGVAMGRTGTDVTREASDMVLADDNFATIVKAVQEGRHIYSNIKRFILYLLSCNVGEVLTLLAAIVVNPQFLPLTAIQILWMNLVTDGLPALALGLEPLEQGVMKKPPRPPSEKLFGKPELAQVFAFGAVEALGTLAVFFIEIADPVKASTMAFTTIVAFELFRALYSRTSARLRQHKWLVAAVTASFAMQFAVVFTPALQPMFNTVTLNATDLAKAFAPSLVLFGALELHKRFKK